ncbi:MAG TPA: sigma-70 family RNA polymerase sigma factor [Desulfotignum sp.]|jgi:RNA polymerase sigma-70 factor, ECF subfamily|nr:sigma-70 family RNA polymerase sigma factor [Desulfotignum sp.]
MTEKETASRQRFKKLTYPHMQLLYNVALKYTGNPFDAQDILQETYLMAFDKFSQLKDPAKIKPWMLRILRNNFLKTCQKESARQQLQKIDYIDYLKSCVDRKDADDLLALDAETRLVNQAIDALPVKYKEILTLYYMEDLRYKDIAKTLDIPMGTVMSRMNRAKEGLKIKLLKQLRDRGHILQIHLETEQT